MGLAFLVLRQPEAPISIAVFPFLEGSGHGTDKSPLGIGMVEEMILRLRTSQRLHVIALSSVLAYDASADDPVRAGRALGVDYVLSGRVAANPDAVRLALRLQDTGSGFDIWSSQAEVLPTELITRLPPRP